ncbi:HWE histidine kinase domain-containing protein [Acuticoccus sp. MNP-M23]|uniref:HWE histidine kinase domain-containing protein n=1 Tax=Acuticoccus sp. MNP-M23 TaxID=3072793 RepID=UPI00281645F8|nr:HWE histidine kinase domain-containing protein [Acuticoccus sp. MNP-M23]WMS42616.1 HWE histidine kinase domain-containing protein [Acuticoccus sp. MNP-M23]
MSQALKIDIQPADLSACDREPIHLLGRIQSFGALIAVSLDWMIVHVSDNIESFCGVAPDDCLGMPLADFLSSDALAILRGRSAAAEDSGTSERIFNQPIFSDGRLFDAAVHRSHGLIVIEVEPSAGGDAIVEVVGLARSMTGQIRARNALPEFLEAAAQQVRRVTGFDRVMVYRFAEDGSGEVVAEARSGRADSFLGLRYPATDIPKQARELYVRNRFRLIADVTDPCANIVPALSPQGEALDLSNSLLRAVSPVHIEYLKNMDVGASLSISIVIDDKLWGLIACHHLTARQVSFHKRTVAELFGELFSLELAHRLQQIAMEHRIAAEAMHDRIMSVVSIDGTPMDNLSPHLGRICEAAGGDGVGLWIDEQYVSEGLALTADETKPLVRFLNRAAAARVYATDHLSAHYPPALAFAGRVSGLLAIPVSRSPRDYLIVFRRELVHTVTWAGNPNKPVNNAAGDARLSPRKSFEAWKENVRCKSLPWSAAELRTAEALRITLLEVIVRSIDHISELRRRSQERQELLIGELNHRVRNMLSLIRGVVAQTSSTATSVPEFSAVLGGRIQALARAHDQLTQEKWGNASLRTLVENEVEAYASDRHERVILQGPCVMLTPTSYTCIALVVHEMVTNSVKYGALSSKAGVLTIRWACSAENGDLTIDWDEKGGPPVNAPTRKGFGSELIHRAIPFELEGTADIDFAPTGLRAKFTVPVRFMGDALPKGETDMPETETRPAGMSAQIDVKSAAILLVEDNVIIAMDAEMMLMGMGFGETIVANSSSQAMEELDKHAFACAVLDINLGNGDSIAIAEALAAKGVPFIFASGYSDAALLPASMKTIPIVTKPYAATKIAEALESAGARLK